MSIIRVIAIATSINLFAVGAVFAQTQSGPVASACAADLETYCAGQTHGSGEARACLEANKDKVSAACKAALDATGGG
ncbi:cysteine rich repeat-containing protein, partial [Pelagibius litoralis]|uniref:cysteine rich repeat-containing protein n=1 Tax=Pelagibius litoralis TaxID=374515 RepID=UPI001981EF5F